MGVSPEYTANLAAAVVGLYQDAERILLERIARALGEDLDAPDWAERKLLQMQLLQAQTVRQVGELTGRSAEEVAAAILKAYNRGAAMGAADLAALAEASTGRVLPPGLPAVEAMVTETVGGLQAANAAILRSTDDVFRQVIARTSPQVLLGTQTRREAAQSALNEFAARGITGFRSRDGRRWALESYVEMSMRASTANAAVAGHTGRLVEAGQDLVVVSDAPQECKVCRPWEGRVLSLTGAPRVDGVRVAGTLDQARRDGLFHPGCRHSVSLYLPGVTSTPSRTADPEGDAARQKLRYLERKTREWKRREAAGLDEPARAAARAKVRGYQAAIRDHVGSTSAKRQPARERVTGLAKTELPKPFRAAQAAPVPSMPGGGTRVRARRSADAPTAPQTPSVAPQRPAASSTRTLQPPAPRQAPQPAPQPPQRRLNAGDVTRAQGEEIAALAMQQARGEITAAEYRRRVRAITGTDSRGRRR